MHKRSRIYVAGHRGMVGSALVRHLDQEGFRNLCLPVREQYDLRSRAAVTSLFSKEHPEYVFLAAAKVGGIWANSVQPADFIHDNLAIELNVIHACQAFGVKKLCFLGSSCIYPKFCPQPIQEDSLLTGPLEVTNEAYAIAKIAGIKLCQAYHAQHGLNAICLMPANLYGPHDRFDTETGHVIPALIRRFHEAKLNRAHEVTIWGTGTPLREFLHVDDLAAACLFLMQNYDHPDILNVGSGEEITIVELAKRVARAVGYTGLFSFDMAKPDGTPRKLLDSGLLQALGWKRTIPLEAGLRSTYEWFLEHPNL